MRRADGAAVNDSDFRFKRNFAWLRPSHGRTAAVGESPAFLGAAGASDSDLAGVLGVGDRVKRPWGGSYGPIAHHILRISSAFAACVLVGL